MKRSLFETILGAVVLLVAGVFAFFATSLADINTGGGYEITAAFNKVGGLTQGNDVRISGVRVGTVKRIQLDPETYKAKASLNMHNDIQLPVDTVAQVVTEGLMGGYYLNLVPGVEDDMIVAGGSIDYTQPPVDLLDLLGRFIFSAENQDKSS